MQLIIAIIRPFKVAELVDAVAGDGAFPGMTVLPCRGFGREKTAPHAAVPVEELLDFVDHSLVLIAAPDAAVAPLRARLIEVVRTGRSGDGKVLIVPLSDAQRIATGEVGEAALR